MTFLQLYPFMILYQITFINPMYHKNLLLKCSNVDFQGREIASIYSESTQLKS